MLRYPLKTRVKTRDPTQEVAVTRRWPSLLDSSTWTDRFRDEPPPLRLAMSCRGIPADATSGQCFRSVSDPLLGAGGSLHTSGPTLDSDGGAPA
jgi:hypothetical protein